MTFPCRELVGNLDRRHLNREQRREVVAWLSGEGMSTRAIGSIVAADEKTVRNDLRSGADISAPDQQYPQARKAPWPERKDAPTLATPSGVVIAEQHRVDMRTGEITNYGNRNL